MEEAKGSGSMKTREEVSGLSGTIKYLLLCIYEMFILDGVLGECSRKLAQII